MYLSKIQDTCIQDNINSIINNGRQDYLPIYLRRYIDSPQAQKNTYYHYYKKNKSKKFITSISFHLTLVRKAYVKNITKCMCQRNYCTHCRKCELVQLLQKPVQRFEKYFKYLYYLMNSLFVINSDNPKYEVKYIFIFTFITA